jgi:predicted transglutaminase-like cysteine proteinase
MGRRGGFLVSKRTVVLLAAAFLAGCNQTSGVMTTAAIGPSTNVADPIRMEARGKAFPPPAFHEFCAREPKLCSTTGSEKSVTLTPASMAELQAVNVAVNRRITEQSDRQSTGKEDDWRLPTTVGDCEDFAILKKHELMKRGWSASALLLTVGRSGGEGHVVLAVRTDKGDLVLDNRTNAIKDWKKAPYSYFARQSQTQHGKWERIS